MSVSSFGERCSRIRTCTTTEMMVENLHHGKNGDDTNKEHEQENSSKEIGSRIFLTMPVGSVMRWKELPVIRVNEILQTIKTGHLQHGGY